MQSTKIFLLILFSTSAFFSNPLRLDAENIYQKGLELQKQDQWRQALQVWLSGKDSLFSGVSPDPRIGFAFIELATRKKASEFYDDAHALYFWGLSRVNLEKHQQEIKSEISRLTPLLSKNEGKEWLELLKKKDQRLLQNIKGFWAKRDPIPTTKINERLIEHWQRIAYVQKEFTRNQNTVYGTDERGLVLVKYGAPDQSISGKLGVEQHELIRWINDFLQRQEIQRYNTMPDFELWKYLNPDAGGTMLFMFGKKTGTGEFGLRNGVDDFLSERSFRRSSTQMTRGILPGALLQLIYYRKLMNVDDFYRQRYRDLESRWTNARAAGLLSPDPQTLRGLFNHYRNIDKKTAGINNLAEDRTRTLDSLEPLYLNFKTFRYLDINRVSRLVAVVVADKQTPDPDFRTGFFKGVHKSKFKFRHVLVSYDKDWTFNEPEAKYPAINNTNTSVFQAVQDSAVQYLILAVERVLLDVRRTQLAQEDLPDTAKVVGIQKVFLGAPRRLELTPGSFEASDLLVGSATPESFRDDLFPFPLIPIDPVKNSREISVYFELYGLQGGESSKPAYKLECELRRQKKKGKTDKKSEFLRKTFRFQPADTDVKNTVALDISDLITGDYLLTVKITDVNSSKVKTRTSGFRLVGWPRTAY